MTAVKTTPKKETIMATRQGPAPEFDTSKMSVEEMIALAAKLTADAAAMSQAKFEENVTWFNGQMKSLGRTKIEAISALVELMDFDEKKAFVAKFQPAAVVQQRTPVPEGEKKPRLARGTKPGKEYKDKDHTGARPQPGVTYKDGDIVWKKAENGLGAVNQIIMKAITAGSTWEDLEANGKKWLEEQAAKV